MNIVRSAGTIRKLEPGFYAVMECSTAEADQSAVAPLMRNKGGTPLLNREEGKSKSVKLKLTESKHNMRHRHEFPHRRQMIFLRKGEQFNGENSGRQYENPKGN
ncbi:hypothetical protein MUK42_17305 [Musa troglodytarum]|uniref:Uncharacterized protein n=1 Tax=Musa troglodytarum TaxID=320322 RepID=A0A9E7EJ68_9LILI|nr:hypothetical protein MUK42_17305 [Musa troglodytarum]URD77979.1 hypothetical protein MUK42_17305 [Musa troglodytarum]